MRFCLLLEGAVVLALAIFFAALESFLSMPNDMQLKEVLACFKSSVQLWLQHV